MKRRSFWSGSTQRTLCIFGALAATIAGSSAETNQFRSSSDLKKLSLEELLDQEVTIVSRTPEKLFESPSAVQVIRGEDIQRSGVTTLPEALRLASNLQVAQHNAHDWAITARGFNGAPLSNNSLADKLLVMIDGRSIYTPLFGGVFWDVQNVLLEDIDRIEVVSGPGSSLWGDNAVNGVINIVTKSAKDTQGTFVSGAGGSFLQDYGGVRYGGSVGTNLFYRVYGQRFDHNSSLTRGGKDANDSWDMTQGGFRLDYYPSDVNTLTLQGDAYSGSEGTPTTAFVDGQNILGRWKHVISGGSDLTVQLYVDRTWRRLPNPGFADELNTYDFDFQHHFPIGERHSILWGGDYRLMQDDTHETVPLSFSPKRRDMQLFSGFVQDEITLVPDRLKLTLGTKLERNDFSGLEVEPSGRLAWMLTPRQTLWTAVSRAVRSPSRFDADEVLPFLSTPGHDFLSEKVLSYEIGYRIRPVDRLSLSFATFYNEYDDLRSIDQNGDPPPVLIFANDQQANAWGFEFSGTYQATDWWRFRGGYTYQDKRIWSVASNVIPSSDGIEANDPKNQFLIQSIMDLPGHIQFDTVGRYVSSLPATALPTPVIPAYFTFDVRLAWQFKQWEFSIVGQNLADRSHGEFGSLEIPRSVYGKITWRF